MNKFAAAGLVLVQVAVVLQGKPLTSNQEAGELSEVLNNTVMKKESPRLASELSNRNGRILATQGKDMLAELTAANGFLSTIELDMGNITFSLTNLTNSLTSSGQQLETAVQTIEGALVNVGSAVSNDFGNLTLSLHNFTSSAAAVVAEKLTELFLNSTKQIDTIVDIIGPASP